MWLLTMVGDVFGDSGKQCWVMVMGVMFLGLVVVANNAG